MPAMDIALPTPLTLLLAALPGFLSALLLAWASHRLLVRRVRQELAEKLRFGYYEKQLAAYQKLWSLLGATSYDPHAKNLLVVRQGERFALDAAAVRRFYGEIHGFFYSEHGIFLSKEIRSLLFEIRDFLEDVIARSPGAEEPISLSRKERKRIQWDFDRVRILARQDVGLPEVGLPRFEPEAGE